MPIWMPENYLSSELVKPMRKFFIICAMIFMMCGNVEAAMIDEGAAVAVMDFEPHNGTSDPNVNLVDAEMTVNEYIIQRLFDTRKFDIIDKDIKRAELKDLNTLGLIDPDTAKKIGEILGVRYIIYGNVTDVSIGNDVEAVVNVNTVKAHLVTRIMDVETGRILMAARGEGKSKSAAVNIDNKNAIMIGNVKVSQDSVHNALQKAAFQAVDILTDRLFGSSKQSKRK